MVSGGVLWCRLVSFSSGGALVAVPGGGSVSESCLVAAAAVAFCCHAWRGRGFGVMSGGGGGGWLSCLAMAGGVWWRLVASAGQASRKVPDKLNDSTLTLNWLAKVVFDVYPPPDRPATMRN